MLAQKSHSMFGFIRYQGFSGGERTCSSAVSLGWAGHCCRWWVVGYRVQGDLLVEPYIAADKVTPKEDTTGEMYNQEIRTALTAGD